MFVTKDASIVINILGFFVNKNAFKLYSTKILKKTGFYFSEVPLLQKIN